MIITMGGDGPMVMVSLVTVTAGLAVFKLSAPSHYLNQCCVVISGDLVTFTCLGAISQEMINISTTDVNLKFINLILQAHFSRAKELIYPVPGA